MEIPAIISTVSHDSGQTGGAESSTGQTCVVDIEQRSTPPQTQPMYSQNSILLGGHIEYDETEAQSFTITHDSETHSTSTTSFKHFPELASDQKFKEYVVQSLEKIKSQLRDPIDRSQEQKMESESPAISAPEIFVQTADAGTLNLPFATLHDFDHFETQFELTDKCYLCSKLVNTLKFSCRGRTIEDVVDTALKALLSDEFAQNVSWMGVASVNRRVFHTTKLKQLDFDAIMKKLPHVTEKDVGISVHLSC